MEPTRYGIEGNAFVIRDATIGDIPDLCKLTYQQFKRENLEAIGHTFSMATSYAKYESAIQSKFFEILVAIVDCNLTGDGKLAGYYAGQYQPFPYNQNIPCLVEGGWCVDRMLEGRGIGWALIAEAEKRARANGVLHMALGTPMFEWNDKRKASYNKRGFIEAEVICYKMLSANKQE